MALTDATLDALRNTLGTDDRAHMSTLSSKAGMIHVVVKDEDSIGQLFKFSRQNGLDTDLFRPSEANEGEVMRGWLG